MSGWAALAAELEAWAASGRRATFWWRDDDAVADTPALRRLLAFGAPVALAVIPAQAEPSLAQALPAHASVLQHGWAHRNHARPGAKKAELGAERPPGVVLGELARGALALDRLFGDGWLRVMVPPYNRIAGAVAAALPQAGYRALSAFGRTAQAGIPCVHVQVDLIDWGRREFAGTGTVLGAVAGDLAHRRAHGFAGPPTGIMTHHLAHDEACWTFLGELFAALRGRAAIVPPPSLFA